MSDQPLAATEIRAYLDEVSEALDPHGPTHTLVLVGGALLALHGLRGATHDVDSVTQLDQELRDAIAAVASRHDLAPKWLNDNAAAFVPQTLNRNDCETIVEQPALVILGAPLDQVFLMKLNASRQSDTDDLEALWPHCTFVHRSKQPTPSTSPTRPRTATPISLTTSAASSEPTTAIEGRDGPQPVSQSDSHDERPRRNSRARTSQPHSGERPGPAGTRRVVPPHRRRQSRLCLASGTRARRPWRREPQLREAAPNAGSERPSHRLPVR